MTMLDKIGLKDFMKSRFALGLVLLTSVAATALTITQASASSTQLKEGEWTLETTISVLPEPVVSAMCMDREMLRHFENPKPAGKHEGFGVEFYPAEFIENGFIQKNSLGTEERVIYSSTEAKQIMYFTDDPPLTQKYKYNGPCKKGDKAGDISASIKDESGEQGTIKLNGNNIAGDVSISIKGESDEQGTIEINTNYKTGDASISIKDESGQKAAVKLNSKDLNE
jgi:hypothetical protein